MTVYGKAKRAKKKEINKKKVFFCIILVIVIIASVVYYIQTKKAKDVNMQPVEEVAEVTTEEPEVEEKQDELVDVSDIPEKMGNYEVLGKLVIDKIGVEKNILAICEDDSLKLSPSKLYGPDLNESGNFVVSGHNWNNMLKRLSEMQVGDTLYMINKQTKAKVEYKVYNMYTCVPEDLSCLDQNSDGSREVTIITCNPGGATRLICKAKEI